MNAIHVLIPPGARKTLYTFALVGILVSVLTGCGGKRAPSLLSPSASPSHTAVPSPSPTAVLSPSPTAVPSPSPTTASSHSVALPDLSPPPDGWIAFRTFDGLLALISPDGSRFVRFTEGGKVEDFLWSPDGRRLAFTRHSDDRIGAQLALVSTEDSRLTTLTAPGTVDPDFTWSQDGHFLAYLWRINPQEARSPLALHVMDLATGQVITVTTYSNSLLPDPEIPSLCPQAFPYPLLPVCMVESPEQCSLDIWDVQTGQKIAALGSISRCGHLWLPEGERLFIPRVEWGEEGIRQEGVEQEIVYPISLAWWRRGDEAPVVILQGRKQQSYEPVRWLSDGRLLFRAMEWEKEEYEGPAEPERVEYRLLSIDEAGKAQEVPGDLPWWAGEGLVERLAAAGLPEDRLHVWEVGPDGVTVILTITEWVEGEGFRYALYLLRGEGGPVRLAMGMYPRWQPR